jgi:hypothetical protein
VAESLIGSNAVGASADATRILKGDGSGGWVDAGVNITVEAGGDLKMNNGTSVVLSSGADRVDFFVSGSACNINSSGGTISHFTTDEIWRFSETIFIQERSGGPAPQVGTYGQLWVDGPNVVGANPNTMHFEDDAGNDYRIDGVQRRALLSDQAIANDDVLTNISNFSNFHIAPARRFKIKATFFWSSGTTPDIQFALNYDQTPEDLGFANWLCTSAVSTVETDVELSALNIIVPTTMPTGTNCILIEWVFESHATLVGTLAIQFAQNVSSAVTTTLLQPSFVEVIENDNIS